MKVGNGSTAWTSLGYTVTDGDISSVTAGTGLSGGGNSGGVTLSLSTPVAVAYGGTGQTTTTAATNALLPSQTSNSGKYLTTDGTNTSWGSVDLSGKTDKSILTTTGDIYYASSANTPARIGIGSSGQVLTVASGIPSWATASGGGSLTLHSTTAMSGNTVSISLPASSAGYKKLILLIVGWTMTGGNGYHTTRFNGVSSTIYFATARSACGHGQDGDSSQINSTGFNFPWPHNMNNGSVGNAHFEMLNPYESSTKLFSWTLSGNEGVGGAPKCAVRGDGAMFYDDVLTSLVMSNDSGGKSYNSGTAYLYGVK